MTSISKKYTPFPPWQTKMSTGKERTYIRLGETQLLDKATLSLTSGAFQTYVYMLLNAKGSKEFIYPKSIYLKICGTEAFNRQKKELIREGFIKISEKGNNIVGKATLYAFSDEWKSELGEPRTKLERAPANSNHP